MTFVGLKFLHVAFMFMGAALAVGPAATLYLIARSGDAAAIRRSFAIVGRVFQISTACYGLGIAFGFAAALSGTLDLTASWLIAAYVLVALLGANGTLFDRWTKQVASGMQSGDADEAILVERLRSARAPLYLLGAMTVLVVAIVYVMVIKPSFS
jgi:hypothetical protein